MIRPAGLKLLIADDHAPMRQTLRAILSPLAGAILEASDAMEAVRLYAEQQPDWVIMDLRMGPVGCLTATRTIRGRFPAARIVILTHYDDPELRAEAAQAGACAYVLKDNLPALTRLLASDAGSNQGSAGNPDITSPRL